MNESFISLGAACDGAMILDSLCLRSKGYPFDWLWNLDSGMDFVCDAILNDFQKISNEKAYTNSDHYRFTHSAVTYREFSHVAHVHSNPMDNKVDHEQLVRRTKRFKETLLDNSHKNFVYYRAVEEDILSGKTKDLEESVRLIINDAMAFMKVLEQKYTGALENMTLILVLQVNKKELIRSKMLLVNELRARNSVYSNKISLHSSVTRNDKDPELNRLWKRQWKSIILKSAKISKSTRFNAWTKRSKRNFKDRVAKLLRRRK